MFWLSNFGSPLENQWLQVGILCIQSGHDAMTVVSHSSNWQWRAHIVVFQAQWFKSKGRLWWFCRKMLRCRDWRTGGSSSPWHRMVRVCCDQLLPGWFCGHQALCRITWPPSATPSLGARTHANAMLLPDLPLPPTPPTTKCSPADRPSAPLQSGRKWLWTLWQNTNSCLSCNLFF